MKQIDSSLLDVLVAQAKGSPRKRAHFNLHPGLDDPVQRLCVAMEPSTYIRPHRHSDPETCEVFLMLRGAAVLLFFNEYGKVTERAVLSARGPVIAAEIPPSTWHAMVSSETGSVFFEVKQGPYAPTTGRNAAPWAPAEGQPETRQFVEWFRNAKIGDEPPAS